MLAQAEPLWSRRQVWLGRCAAIPLGLANVLMLLFCVTAGHYIVPPLPNLPREPRKQILWPVLLPPVSKRPVKPTIDPRWPDMKVLIHMPIPFRKIKPPFIPPEPPTINQVKPWVSPCNCKTDALVIRDRVVPPSIVSKVTPVYPDIARRLRIEGAVILEVVVDTLGNVCEVRILRDLPFGLGMAAIEAVKKWKYAPATLNGEPVCMYLAVGVTFTLT